MLKTVWKKQYPQSFSHYVNLKMADYISRRSVHLISVRKNQQMAIFANDYIGILINQFGYFEHEELSDLFEYLSPLHAEFEDGVALDIGANIGNHTLFFSNYFRLVHSFEPNPRTYELLKFNTSPVSNVVTHSIGLGDSKGEFELTQDLVNHGLSSMKFTSVSTADPVKVKVDTLDELSFEGQSEICFVKMDVEGFEENVIRGGVKMISKNQPLIILEQHESEFSGGCSPSITLLRGLGYKFSWKHKSKPSKFWLGRRLAELWEILSGRDCRYVSANEVPPANYTMLVAVPPRFQKPLGE